MSDPFGQIEQMIHYALKCADGHGFESWFQSASAFDKLLSAGMLTCAVCGSSDVKKAIMAPRVGANTANPKVEEQPAAENTRPLTGEKTPAEQALAALKSHIEKNSDYVGKDFADEARAIHEGTAPERPIHGEANREEAKKLIDEGVPVAPLPFTPNRKTN